MKKSEVKIGGHYLASVSGKLVTVRLDEINEETRYTGKLGTYYQVTNLSTGRKCTFRSAMKFRCATLSPAQEAHILARDTAKIAAVNERLSNEESAKAAPTCCKTGACEELVEGEKGSDPIVAQTAIADCQPLGVATGASATSGSTPLTTLLRRSTSVETAAPHVLVEARAGSGKTTTIVEGLKRLKGIESKLIPSPQQAAVWESMLLSQAAKTICFVAFNKSIATELQARVPAGCEAMTMHSMGLKAVTKALGRLDINSFVVQDLIAELMGSDIRELRRTNPVVIKATEDLVSLCKMNLSGTSEEDLSKLATHYDVDLNHSRTEVFDLVPQILERCRNPKGRIGFDDMVYLPVALSLPVFRYDLLLVDECQDLNRCQQALAKMAGRRLILVGDPKQAIYGFAGADAESMPRMFKELSTDCPRCGKAGTPANTTCECGEKMDWTKGPGCIKLPLTVTRRCGRAIVAEANKIVPDIQAHESNGEGKVSSARYPIQESNGVKTELPWEQTYAAQAQDGDMILCRVNSPLVSQVFRFLKRGIKANIQGRDIGQGLVSTVKKSKAGTVNQLVSWLSYWLDKEVCQENSKKFPNEARVISLTDKHDCLMCFAEGASSVEEVIKRINDIFTDDKSTKGIRLSSGHRAKGLEARRVFILMPKGATCPHPMAKSAWQVQQELNLLYVMQTRAIEELVYVT